MIHRGWSKFGDFISCPFILFFFLLIFYIATYSALPRDEALEKRTMVMPVYG